MTIIITVKIASKDKVAIGKGLLAIRTSFTAGARLTWETAVLLLRAVGVIEREWEAAALLFAFPWADLVA
jgi:hypothetical protein